MFVDMVSRRSRPRVSLPPQPESEVVPLDDRKAFEPCVPGHGAGSRWDPIYDRHRDWVWWWDCRRRAEARQAKGERTGRSQDLRRSVDKARQLVREDPDAILALGAINQWVTITSQQAGAFVGWPVEPHRGRPQWRREPRVLRLLWEAGLVEVGQLDGYTSAGTPRAWRLLPDDGFADTLSVDARYTVHANLGWKLGPVGPSHSIVAAELGLRLAQSGYIDTVVGEPLSAHRLLLPSPATKHSPAACDLTMYGPWGKKVAVEVTCSRSRKDVARKVDRLVRSLIAMRGSEGSSVAVCILDAILPGDRHGSAVRMIYEEVHRALRSEPAGVYHELSERMFIARWTDWFPAPGTAIQDWRLLPAYKTGPDGPTTVDALAHAWVRLEPESGHADAVAATRFLGGTPAHVRSRLIEQHGDLDLEALYLRHSGLDVLLHRPAV